MKTENQKQVEHEPEVVGRKYTKTRYGLHSRELGTKDWFGTSHYKTQEAAQAALDSIGGRFQNVGHITVDFGEAKYLYEYRITEEVSDCTVLSASIKKV